MSRTASTLLFARKLAAFYRSAASNIDREAAGKPLANMPLSRRILRQYAIIARRAAIAEELDPEPK